MIRFPHHHIRAAKIRAAALSPRRESNPSGRAPLPAGVEVDVALAESDEEVTMFVTILEGVLVGRREEGDEEGAEEAGTDADEETLPPGAPGAGTALETSTRLPVPQGMGSLDPGWVGFAGGVAAPAAEAIVNRVVQVLTLVCGEEYWKK